MLLKREALPPEFEKLLKRDALLERGALRKLEELLELLKLLMLLELLELLELLSSGESSKSFELEELSSESLELDELLKLLELLELLILDELLDAPVPMPNPTLAELLLPAPIPPRLMPA